MIRFELIDSQYNLVKTVFNNITTACSRNDVARVAEELPYLNTQLEHLSELAKEYALGEFRLEQQNRRLQGENRKLREEKLLEQLRKEL